MVETDGEMPRRGSYLLALQSITQLGIRGLSYVAILLVLPSFILITDASTYANIVLVSTIVSLAALFDGGQAVALLTLLSRPAFQTSRRKFRSAVISAIKGSAIWSMLISLVFMGLWILLSPNHESIENTFLIIISCTVLSVITTTANTLGRALLTKDFSIFTAVALLSGPLISLIILVILRFFGNGSPFPIIFAFAMGGLCIIFFGGGKFYRLKFDSLTEKCKTESSKYLEKNEDKKHRLWIFLSQIISIAVVGKTPILIRLLCGDQALGLFSLFAAANAIIVAPVAAMQAPLLVKYVKMLGTGKVSANSIFIMLARHIAVAIILGFLGVGFLVSIVSIVGQFISKDFSQLSYQNLFIISASASVYIFSVIVAIFLNAMGRAKLMVYMAVMVLFVDMIFIFLLSKYFGALTPILTMPIANGIVFLLFGFGIIKDIKNTEKLN